MLEKLGLSSSDVRIYRGVARNAGLTIAQLTEATAMSPGALAAGARRLLDAGLVVAGEKGELQINPVGPEVALERLRAQVESEYNQHREKVSEVHGELSQIASEGLLSGGDDAAPPVDVLTNTGAAKRQLLALTGHTRHELLRMVTSTGYAQSDRDLRGLRHGVETRSIYPSAALLEDEQRAIAGVGAGAVRVVSSPPAGLHVFDRRVAILESEPTGTSFIVHGPMLVRVLHSFFETWWNLGRVAAEGGDGVGSSLTDEELVLLQFLSDGVKDEQVARRLGLSVRTVRRKVSILLERLDASSRFQAGVLASRRGWI